MRYRIEILDAETSGALGAGPLGFASAPLVPALGDYMPIGGLTYRVASRDFLYSKEECLVCVQLQLANREPPPG